MRRAYAIVAATAAVLLVVGSIFYWFFGLTFGLISGLVVLLAPAYPLLVQALLVVMVVGLCLWREARTTALVLGLGLTILPQGGLVGWYAHARYTCGTGPDPEACLAYLDGSPLLPIFVAFAAVVALIEAGVLVAVVAADRRFGEGARASR